MVKDAYERLAANFGGAVTLDVIQRVSSKSRLAHARGMSNTSPVVLFGSNSIIDYRRV